MLAQRLNITLPYTLARDFKRAIPVKKRSKFIAEAVQERLGRTDLKKQLQKSAQAQEKIIKEIQEDFKYADAEVPGFIGPDVIKFSRQKGLEKESALITTQIRSIDKDRLIKKIGKISKQKLLEVEEAIKLVLGFTATA